MRNEEEPVFLRYLHVQCNKKTLLRNRILHTFCIIVYTTVLRNDYRLFIAQSKSSIKVQNVIIIPIYGRPNKSAEGR